MSELLRENSFFIFCHEQHQEFEKLMSVLSENPILRIFKQGGRLPRLLHADASKRGLGAVLLKEAEDRKVHSMY